LLQAFDLADQAVTRLKKEAEDSRWTIVTQKLKTLKKTALYSVRACRERYEALQNGTATLPAEDRESLEQQTTQKNSGEAPIERIEVDPAAPSKSVAKKDTRRRSGRPLVVEDDDSDESSDISDTEGGLANPTPNQHLSSLIMSGIDLSAITNLPFKAQVASASIGRKAPDLPKDLKEVTDMNRDELREELRMRGLCSDGLRAQMEETLKAARAGNTDLKQSPKNAMNLTFRRPPKPVKKSAARRLSAILLSDAEEAANEDNEGGPRQKRAKTGGSSKAVATERPAPAPTANTERPASVATTNIQSFQGPTLSDEIFGLLYLPLADTNLQLVYQKEVEDGCRVFLSNVPSSFTANAIRTILSAYSLKAVHTLRAAGNLVVDCADVETAVGVTTALDGLALKDQAIVVENAQVVAQKYFAARNPAPSTQAPSNQAPSNQAPSNQAPSTQAPSTQAPSTQAPSTQASTPVVGSSIRGPYTPIVCRRWPSTPVVESVSNTPKPKPLIQKASKSPSKMMCRLVVKNVPSSVDAMQLQQVFGKLSGCERIDRGIWLMEFSDASAAERCYTTRNGERVHGQDLELVKCLPEALKVSRRRLTQHNPTKQEADTYDDVL